MAKKGNRYVNGFVEVIWKFVWQANRRGAGFMTACPCLQRIVLTMIVTCGLPTLLYPQEVKPLPYPEDEVETGHDVSPVATLTRPLTIDETAQQWRDETPHRYLIVYGDFDDDGRLELASLDMQFTRREEGALRLSVTGGDPLTDDAVLAKVSMEELPTRGIDLIEPGEYETACGKWLRTCLRDEPRTLTLTRPAISFFELVSPGIFASRIFFYFDVNTKSWARVDIDLQ